MEKVLIKFEYLVLTSNNKNRAEVADSERKEFLAQKEFVGDYYFVYSDDEPQFQIVLIVNF